MKLQLEEIREDITEIVNSCTEINVLTHIYDILKEGGYSYPTDYNRFIKEFEIERAESKHILEEQQKEFDILITISELSEKHLSTNQKEEFHKSLGIILNVMEKELDKENLDL